MAMAEIIKSKLEAALAPQVLDIDDQSERHRGHAGYREGGESHFHLTIVSDAFAGKSRIDRQRLVHRALAEELKEKIHALSMSVKAPGE
ncbi:MAG: BolA family transcriptional regulator [Proteobacteria bacterium]|nr:BolA family transcriptional regulator [Pseudomonadota bacterium]